MIKKRIFPRKLPIISFLWAILTILFLSNPVQAHSDDLSVAQFFVNPQQTNVNLAVPTSIFLFADDNQDNQLSAAEINQHQLPLEEFISNRLVLINSNGEEGKITVKPSTKNSLPYIIKDRNRTHSQLLVQYNWSEPVENLTIKYELFPQGIPTAHCLASIFYQQQTQNYIFSRNNTELLVNGGNNSRLLAKNLFVTVVIAFIWGSFHALSPGHGKSMVIAYLVSSRANIQQAIFLGLMTTSTHTLGIFALGLGTLFLSKYILPEQLYPFLSLFSGLGIVIVASWLFKQRVLDYSKHHHHHHPDSHHSHQHSHRHLSLTVEESKIEWSSLVSLGFSSGLIPCPAALILLLGTISVGNISLGILLVLIFSFGLAVTLISIGILCIKAKALFAKIPNRIDFSQKLSIVAPVIMFIIGLVMTFKAVIQLPLVI
jgi:ABC-type nickel/cobalt efflux system permease component RcnA